MQSQPTPTLGTQILQIVVARPKASFMVALGILLFGGVSFFSLQINPMPTLPIPLVHVITEYPGISAPEIEQLVTIPLENALSAVKGLRGMESLTKEEISTVTLRFDWGVDIRRVNVDVREKIDSAFPYLPFGIRKPLVLTEDLNAEPILILALLPKDGRTLIELSPLIQKDLSSRFLRIPGISTLRIAGIREPQILVEGEPELLRATGFTLQDIASSIGEHVFEAAVGTVTEEGREYLVRTDTGIKTVDALAQIPLTTVGAAKPQNTGTVRIADVCSVQWKEREKTSFFHLNGQEAIGIFLYKSPNVGSLNLAKQVRSLIPELNTLYQREFTLQIIQDSTVEVGSTFRNLLWSMGMGILAVCIVLSLGLPDRGASLIVTLSIPLSACSVFLLMHFTRIQVNLVSLTGIALGIGMIVDNSIVVLDKLYSSKAKTEREICLRVKETVPSLFASTITTVAVFLPILFLPNVLGALFRDLALTTSFLILTSFGIAITLTPAMFSYLKSKAPMGTCKKSRIDRIAALYHSYLVYAFKHPCLVLSLGLLLVCGSLLTFFLLPKRVFPPQESSILILSITFPPGTPLTTTEKETARIEERLLTLPSIRQVFGYAGYEPTSLRDKGHADRNSWTVAITVLLHNDKKRGAAREIAALCGQIRGIQYHVGAPQEPSSRLLGGGDSIQYRLWGSDREALVRYTEELLTRARAPSLISSYTSNTVKALPRKTFHVDEPTAAFYGITPRSILETLSLSIRGREVASLFLSGEEVPILLRLRNGSTLEGEELNKVPFALAGAVMEIGTLGVFRNTHTYPELHRMNRKPSLTLTLYPNPGLEKELEQFLAAYPEAAKAATPPVSSTLLSRSSIEENGIHILKVFGFALLLMYLVLGAQFESFHIPLLLLTSFPLSVSGSFLILLLFGFSLNLNSFLGILVVLGTTINGTILLTSSFTHKTKEGIIDSSLEHLRPLLATVNTTLVALLPLLWDGKGSVQTNTALSLAGGLGLGTLGILAVYPLFFWLSIHGKASKL